MTDLQRDMQKDVQRGNKKNILWRLLKSAFLKARENVRKKKGASFRVRSPEHFAIDVLNEHYGKRKEAKPKNYSEKELDHAITVAQSAGFIEALEEAITVSLLSPENQLPPQEHPEPPRVQPKEPAAPSKPVVHPDLRQFREEIEKAGGEVRDLKKVGDNLFAVEIATPLAVYRDRGTREEILMQVQRDVEADVN